MKKNKKACVPPNIGSECSSQSACRSGQDPYNSISTILKGNLSIARILHKDMHFLEQLELAYDWTTDDLFYILNSLKELAHNSYLEGLG